MDWTPTQTVTAVAGGLQVVGVVVVVVEAWRVRRLFSVASPPLAFRVAEIIRQRWPWRRPRVVYGSAAISSGTGNVSATLTRSVVRPTSVEERVSRLERDTDELREHRETNQREAAERHAEVGRRQDATDARITDALGEQRKTLEAATSARAPMHLWGVMALLAGLVLSVSPEVDVTVWQWESWSLRAVMAVALVVGSTFVKGT